MDVLDTCDALETCSIDDERCQRDVLALTACVRGDETPPLPPIRALSRAELATEQATDSEQTASSAALARALVALRLVTGKTSLDKARATERLKSVAAFYRSETKEVTLISDSMQEPRRAMITLAHELTHYLQDRAGQLAVAHTADVSSDESVARRALTEGEAVVTSNRMSVAMKGRDDRYVPWAALWDAMEESNAAAISASESPLLAANLLLPYVLGAPTIEALWERGRARVNELFDRPRLTGLDWLIEPVLPTPTHAEALDCYPALAPDGYRVVAVESLGIAGLFALLATQNKASLRAASHWRQDVLAVYLDDSDNTDVLALWRIRFDSDQNAKQVANTLEPLGLSVASHGRELTIRVQRDSLATLDDTTCPSHQELLAAVSMPLTAATGDRPDPRAR